MALGLVLGFGLAPGTAHATGGLACRVDDNNLKLDFDGVYSHSIPKIHAVSGEFRSKLPRTPKSLQQFTLDSSDLLQQWWQDSALKLLIYRETQGDDPFASVQLVIQTTRSSNEELRYVGDYQLRLSSAGDGGQPPVTAGGNVSCWDSQ
ncbi:hypothetical protein BST27_01065 [Mycobacterium intermedium]|uniref:Uncharacterized protein n=1 Tax=Mycobacterium intermedium TaxID=28445 RepID=A0A1E3SG05_MYCIE|nr:hypothetical protein BHQ20_10235 [Mycobacterium intermedium]OPE52423.1 hypothetical protein BV508_02320 [Mycobacterium intermedium]ORB10475.1 hypothetical protein BST27_01065 [Mycobacterium intermedium]